MSGKNEKVSRSQQRRLREGATLERERIKLITDVGAKYGQVELAAKCVEDGTALNKFNGLVLDSLPAAQDYTPETFSPEAHEPGEPSNRNAIRPASEWRDQDGNAVMCLRGSESLSQKLIERGDIPVEQRGLDIGQAVCSLITGRWPEDGILQRAMAGGSGVSGGFHLVPALSSELIDLARKKSVLMLAGAQTVLMDSSELAIVRVLTDPAVGFVAENQDIPLVEPTFGRVTFRARKLAARVAISVELVQDAPNAAEEVRTQLGKVLALALDLAAISGTGDGEEIVGLFQHSGVSELAAIGSPDYDDLLLAIQTSEDANGVPNAYLITPDTKQTLSALKDTPGNYLQPPSAVTELKRFVTRQLTNAQAVVGDISQVLFGIRQDITIEISSEGGDAWKKDQVEIKIRWRGDMQLAQAAHIVRLVGIT